MRLEEGLVRPVKILLTRL